MIYSSKRAAALTLIEFTPAMRRLHVVVPATTAGGKRVGWTVIMRSRPRLSGEVGK